MKKKELNKILRLHNMWLNDEEGGKRADFRQTDLRNSDLREADLRNSDLQYAKLQDADLRNSDLRGVVWDFSCFPLWCGGSYFKTDVMLLRQLAAHMCTLECDDDEWLALKEAFMRYSRSVKVSILKRVLPPENRSIRSVSQETGISEQTIMKLKGL